MLSRWVGSLRQPHDTKGRKQACCSFFTPNRLEYSYGKTIGVVSCTAVLRHSGIKYHRSRGSREPVVGVVSVFMSGELDLVNHSQGGVYVRVARPPQRHTTSVLEAE